MNGAYDEMGNFYQMPEFVISDPVNMIQGTEHNNAKSENDSDVSDEDEIKQRREEKGKAVLKAGDLIKVKARLSDRGGPDIVISMGKEQNVRILVRRIQEEVNVRSPQSLLMRRAC